MEFQRGTYGTPDAPVVQSGSGEQSATLGPKFRG
jgi:hypothetical protein